MKNLLYFILVLLLPEMAMTQNLIVGSGSSFTVSSGTDISVAGNVTNSSGGNIINAGTVSLTGDWTNNGTSDVGATGTITFAGTSLENIAGSISTNFGNITLNNSAGIILSGSVGATVNTTLAFTSGRFGTGSNVLTLGSSGNVTGAGAGKYVNGNFQKSVSGSSPSVSFEIGDASIYAPLGLAFHGTASGSVTAKTTSGQHPNIGTSKINSSQDVSRFWTLSNNSVSGFSSVDPTFNYPASDITLGANASQFIAEQYAGSTWSILTPIGTPSITSTTVSGVTAVEGDYAVGDTGVVLISVATHPSNAMTCSGSTASFTSTSTSIPTPTIQWQENQGSGWNDVVAGGVYGNPTASPLVLTGVTTAMNTYQYRAIFHNLNGYATSNGATLTVNALPTPSIGTSGATTFCSSSSVTLDAGIYSTYLWSSNAGSSPNETVSATATGNYIVTVTDANSCTATASQSVTVNSNPTAGITGTTSGCGSVSLTATGGTSYSWSPAGSSQTTAANAFSTGVTSVSVTVTDGNSCSATASQSITVNAAPTAGITGATTGCGSVSLTATGGTSYSWSPAGSSQTTAANTFSTGVTSVSVTVTDGNSCTATTTQSLTIYANPVVSIGADGPTSFCTGGNVTLHAGTAYVSPYTYAWSDLSTNESVIGYSTGTFSVVVTDGNGCSGSATQSLVVNPNLTVNITGSGSPSQFTGCGSVTIDAGGGYQSYQWNDINNSTGQTISPTSTGTYSVTVSAGGGCTGTSSQPVTINTPPTAGITGSTSGCGSVSLTATGGTSYSWSPAGSSQTTAANTFSTGVTSVSVTVTDGNSCTAATSQSITVNTSPTAAITGTATGCGSVSLTATGGTSYSWSPAGSSQTTAANTFSTGVTSVSVTVTDGNSCTATTSQSITVYSAPTVSPSSNSPVTSGNNISLSSGVSGGTTPYSSYHWTGPNTYSNTGAVDPVTILNSTSLNQGTYNVTVTDAHSCTASGNTSVIITGGSGGFVWSGAFSTDFTDANNWVGNAAPTSGCATNVTIPAASGGSFNPTISSPMSLGNVTVASGAIVTNNTTLSICGTWIGGSSTATVGGTGTVIFNGSSSQTFSGATQFEELVIDNSAGVSLSSGAALKIRTALDLQLGDFNVSAGTITFLSTSTTQCGILDNFSSGYTGTITGNIRAQRYYTAASTFNQHFMGSPVNAPLLSQFGASGASGYVTPIPSCDENIMAGGSPFGNVYNLVESHGSVCGMAQWYVEPGSNHAVNGLGYSVREATGAGTLTVTGPANLQPIYQLTGITNSDWHNTTAQGHLLGSGWHLVANPYLATLKIDSLDENIANQIQVWNTSGQYAGSYQAYQAGSSGAIVPPFQGFMVKYTDTVTPGTFTIHGGSRTRNPQAFFLQNDNQLDITAENLSTGLLDKTTVAFNSNATDGFDDRFDADKFAGDVSRHTLYSLNNDKWLAINILNSVSNTSTVPVGFDPGVSGNYAFNFTGVNTFDPTSYIFLEDTKVGTMTDVRNGIYNFTSNTTDNRNRFVLHFTPPAVVSSVNASCSSMGLISVTQPGTANWNYQVKDNNNAIIATGILNESNSMSVNAQAGTYTLTLVDNNNYMVTKSIVIGGAQDITAGFNMPSTTATVQTEVSFNSTSQNANNFSWNFGDGAIVTGVINPSHTYTTAGTYIVTLTVTNATGCSSSVSQALTVAGVTGVGNLATNNINMWSNAGRVYVDFSQAGKVDAVIKIFDILGQELSKDKYTTNSIYQKAIDQIDAAYVIVSVKNEDKVITRKLFIVNTQQ